MPIKRAVPAAAAAPAPKGIKRGVPQRGNDDGPTKEDLLDHLLVVTRREYEPEFMTANGPSPRAIVDLIDLDDDGAKHEEFWIFGVAARGISEWLEQDGEIGLGRLVQGTSKAGRQFWNIAWSDEDADHARADMAVAPF